MSCWADAYVTQPADKTLKKNCLGWARRIMWEVFHRKIPNFLGVMRAVRNGTPLPVRQVKRLTNGTLIVFGNKVNPCRHVGVYCLSADRVVHADTDAGYVKADPMWKLRTEWSVIGFYEVTA